MSNRKLGLKVLSLSFLAALAFSAIAASGAQAGKWFISNAAFHGTKTISGSGTGGRLLVIGLNKECGGWSLTGEINELDRGLVTMTFEECVILEGSPLEPSSVCAINASFGEPGSGEFVASAKFLAFLHGGETYVLFEPDVTGILNERTFTTLEIVDAEEGSGECAISGPKALKGTMVALVLASATESLSHELHLVSESVQLSLFPLDFLHIGANRATLDSASASVRLVSDENWSFR